MPVCQKYQYQKNDVLLILDKLYFQKLKYLFNTSSISLFTALTETLHHNRLTTASGAQLISQCCGNCIAVCIPASDNKAVAILIIFL